MLARTLRLCSAAPKIPRAMLEAQLLCAPRVFEVNGCKNRSLLFLMARSFEGAPFERRWDPFTAERRGYKLFFVQFVFFLSSKMLEPSSNLVALMRNATAIKSQEDNGRRGASTPALWIWFVGLDSCTGTEHVVVSDTNIFPDIPHHGGKFFLKKIGEIMRAHPHSCAAKNSVSAGRRVHHIKFQVGKGLLPKIGFVQIQRGPLSIEQKWSVHAKPHTLLRLVLHQTGTLPNEMMT